MVSFWVKLIVRNKLQIPRFLFAKPIKNLIYNHDFIHSPNHHPSRHPHTLFLVFTPHHSHIPAGETGFTVAVAAVGTSSSHRNHLPESEFLRRTQTFTRFG
ncbi:hypothetical protein HanRHA438_Chr02g0080701 [Helianthus annuus]|nr:hypothetical protein HanRHA438_Chr02g0080701 [Helianthus annuus]